MIIRPTLTAGNVSVTGKKPEAIRLNPLPAESKALTDETNDTIDGAESLEATFACDRKGWELRQEKSGQQLRNSV